MEVNFFDIADGSELEALHRVNSDHLIMLCDDHAAEYAGEVWFEFYGDNDCYCEIPGCDKNNRQRY